MKSSVRGAGLAARIFTVSGLAAIFVPLLVITLWHLVRNWGWWRIKSEQGDPRYVKTWHGWVAKDTSEHKQKIFWYRNIYGGRATTAHDVRIAWTPKGAGTHRAIQKRRGTGLRQMLQWFGFYTTNERGVGSSTDVEMGTIPEPPTIRITEASVADTVRSRYFLKPMSIEQVDGPSESGSIRTSHVMSGALRHSSGVEDIEDTVRRRRGSTEHSPVWKANSSETSRATITQFIMPTHNFRTPVWADQLFSIGASRGTTTPLSCRKSSGNQVQAQERSRALSKLSYTPPVQSAASIRIRRGVRSSPASSPPLIMSALAGLRSSTQLSAAIDLDDLSTYLESNSAYGRYGSLTAGRVLPFEVMEALSSPAIVRSQSLTQRFKARARPSVMGILPNIRRRISGENKHDKLDGQPVAESKILVGAQNALPEHEDEESLYGTTPYHEDIQTSAVTTPQPRMTGLGENNSNLGPASQHSLGHTQDTSNAALPLTSLTNLATHLGSIAPQSSGPKPKEAGFESLSPPKRGAPTKVSELTGFPTPKLLPCRSTTRSSIVPSIVLPEAKTTTPQPSHSPVEVKFPLLSAAEKAHQDEELRQRLQWLDLRCTIKKKEAALGILSENQGPIAGPQSNYSVLRKSGGLRRVGRFERGSQQQATVVGVKRYLDQACE